MTQRIAPPGESPHDPYRKDIDVVGFALSRTLCYIMWINEHSHSFVELRQSDPVRAEEELKNLLHSVAEALQHSRRLRDLLLAGHTFDRAKRLPEGLADQ